MDKFLNVAKRAAYQAGEFLLANLDKAGEIHFKGEGHRNPFSRIDEGAEDIILTIIGDTFPEANFISEERGEKNVSSDYTWIIDPLDGTINFIHKYRYFGISIALSYQEDVVLGVGYNPLTDEMFTARKGEGAYLNEKRIRVSQTARLDESLLAIGFPYDRTSEAFIKSMNNFTRLARDSQAIRRDGSTVLDLCNVACGRYDGFCVAGNELWDYAAGILLVAEAGGRVTDFKGDLFHINKNSDEVLATNGKIHETILSYLGDVEAI